MWVEWDRVELSVVRVKLWAVLLRDLGAMMTISDLSDLVGVSAGKVGGD